MKLLSDPKEELVEEIAAQLGLRKVGWIFTDLVPLPGNIHNILTRIETGYKNESNTYLSGIPSETNVV